MPRGVKLTDYEVIERRYREALSRLIYLLRREKPATAEQLAYQRGLVEQYRATFKGRTLASLTAALEVAARDAEQEAR